eukprot:509696-Prorocentrum_minimum.AAC.3
MSDLLRRWLYEEIGVASSIDNFEQVNMSNLLRQMDRKAFQGSTTGCSAPAGRMCSCTLNKSRFCGVFNRLTGHNKHMGIYKYVYVYV